MTENKKRTAIGTGCAAGCLLALFFVLILLLCTVDVRPIGAAGTEIGLAAWNGAVRDAIGFHRVLYIVTGVIGYFAFAAPAFFVGLGVYQLIRRRRFCLVDADLYLLGGIYLVTGAAYVLFEKVVINYRPVLLGAEPEPSFPSSHMVLAVVLFGTAMVEIAHRVRVKWLMAVGESICGALLLALVCGRVFSGVHWLTDILGGLLLGGALLLAFLSGTAALAARPAVVA